LLEVADENPMVGAPAEIGDWSKIANPVALVAYLLRLLCDFHPCFAHGNYGFARYSGTEVLSSSAEHSSMWRLYSSSVFSLFVEMPICH
jgi:hypothetical protein